MAAGLKQLYTKIANSKASMGGNHIQHGRYLFEVLRVLIDPEKHNGTMFIAEFRVREAAPLSDEIKPNRVGSDCSYVTNLTKNDSAMGNVKAFTLGLYGLEEANMTEEDVTELAQVIEELTNTNPSATRPGENGQPEAMPVQPARGMLIRCSTIRKESKKKEMLTLPKWERVEQTPEEIAARRKALDAAPAPKAA